MNDELSGNTETEASHIGWTPKEQFRGDPEKWVDAETFLRRGKEIMPILKKNNEVLQGRLSSTEAELARLRGIVEAAQESMEAMKELQSSSVRQAIERTRSELVAGLKEAKISGDVDAELQIQEQLGEVNAQLTAIKKEPTVPKDPNPNPKPEIDPYTQKWASENPWFEKDIAKTALAMGIAQEIRKNPETSVLTGEAFFNKLSERLAEYDPARRDGPSKVASTRAAASGNSTSDGNSYADLPAEAKAECNKEAKKFVGEGRAFKNEQAWQSHFAKLYFGA